MADFIVRDASDLDEDAIIDLLQRGMGPGAAPRTRAYWRWKHRAAPFGGSYLRVAEADGRIVGLRAFLRWTWWSGRRPVPAVRAVDTVTHPDWRGHGVFTRLTLDLVERVSWDGVAFVYNTPGAASLPGYLKMGWVSLGRLTPWMRPFARAFRSSLRAVTVLRPARDLIAAPGLDRLLERLGEEEDPRFTVRLDRPYLAWRYQPPGLLYHAAWRLEGDDPAALVFRIVPRGGRMELRVCEALVPSTTASVRQARRLLADSARAAGADFASLFAPAGTAARRLARGAGFLPLPRRGPVLTARVLNQESALPDPCRRQSWRASIGSLELF